MRWLSGISVIAVLVVAASAQQLRPTVTSGGYQSPASAYDGNLTSASSKFVFCEIGSKLGFETWSGFPVRPPGRTGLKLFVNSAASPVSVGGEVELLYSFDGGATFNTIYNIWGQNRGQQTNSVNIADSQDLTKVQVYASVHCNYVPPPNPEPYAGQSVYEIWIQ